MRFVALIIRLATFVLSGFGIFMMTQVLAKTHATQSPTIPPPPVAPPTKPFESAIAGTGLIEAAAENVQMGVPAPGIVSEVLVKVADTVKRGDPLMKISDHELRAQLITQQASIAVAKATVELKQATLAKIQDMLDRMNAIADKRAISMDDLKNRIQDVAVAKADLDAAKAQIVASEAAVTATNLLLDKLTVRAPRDGTILQVNTRVGEYASTQPKLAPIVLGDLATLQVRCDIDEQNAPKVRSDQPAKAFVKGDSLNSIDLTFVRIDPFVIPKQSLTGGSTERVDTRVLQVIYRLEKPTDKALYVGQQVDVFIQK
jgi:HlyD family secretion protein